MGFASNGFLQNKDSIEGVLLQRVLYKMEMG
jgi:hypothetical protein